MLAGVDRVYSCLPSTFFLQLLDARRGLLHYYTHCLLVLREYLDRSEELQLLLHSKFGMLKWLLRIIIFSP